MNNEVKELWIDALLSGDYKQTHGRLKGSEAWRESDGFCCLGVLCDLAEKNHVGHWDGETYRGNTPNPYSGDYSDAAVLPWEVVEWAGLKEANPCIDASTTFPDDPEYLLSVGSLADANDTGYDFPHIAAIIRDQL